MSILDNIEFTVGILQLLLKSIWWWFLLLSLFWMLAVGFFHGSSAMLSKQAQGILNRPSAAGWKNLKLTLFWKGTWRSWWLRFGYWVLSNLGRIWYNLWIPDNVQPKKVSLINSDIRGWIRATTPAFSSQLILWFHFIPATQPVECRSCQGCVKTPPPPTPTHTHKSET